MVTLWSHIAEHLRCRRCCLLFLSKGNLQVARTCSSNEIFLLVGIGIGAMMVMSYRSAIGHLTQLIHSKYKLWLK